MIAGTTSASAIRDGLLEAVAGSIQHRRLYLRDHFGITPQEVFHEIEPLLDEAVSMGMTTSGAPRSIAAIRRGNVVLIPYLVDEAGPRSRAARNRGLRGFAGTLRTDFAQAVRPGDVHVLLILDSDPFETILTAAEDAASLPQLSWANLILRLGTKSSGPAAEVVHKVSEDLTKREPAQHRSLLDAFAGFASRGWASVSDAGLALPSIGCYVADPTPTSERLEASARWRQDLDRWSLPDRDLAAELARRCGEDHPGIQKVTEAHGPHGLDYSRFTLDDLPPAKQYGRIAIVEPPQVRDALAAVSAEGVSAIWIAPKARGFALALRGKLGASRPKVRWHDGTVYACDVEEGRMLLHVPVPGEGKEGWWFATVRVRSGSSVQVGVCRRDGGWFPVEESLQLDGTIGCFRASDPPAVLAIGSGGDVLGEARVILPEPDSEELQVATAIHGEDCSGIPLAVESLSPPDDGDGGDDAPEEPDPGDTGGADDEPPGGGVWDDDPDDFDRPVGPKPGTYPEAESAAHALLELAGRRKHDGISLPQGLPTISVARTCSFWLEGSIRYDLVSQHLSADLGGLEAEQAILQIGHSSTTLAFAQTHNDRGEMELVADPSLDQLRLDGLEAGLLNRFFNARHAFFEALQHTGTAHALLCGVALNEAHAYVVAYHDLLASLEVPGRYTRELDRLLLVDLVSSEDGNQCWLAPTNPVTVAWILELARQLPAMAAGGDLPDRDVKALSPRFLLPLLHAHGGWWEVDDRSPLLWRRYRPLGSSLALGGSNHQTITGRMEKFLKVFPAYRDPRQRLAVAFREPGDGGSVAEALRRFYRPEIAPEARPSCPGLDVTVYTDDGETPGKLRELMAPDNDRDLDRLVRSRVKLSTEYSEEEPRFAHLCFAFRSSASREPRQVRIDERSPTNWVGGLAASSGRTSSPNSNELSFTSGLFVAPKPAGVLQALLQRTLEMVGAQPHGYMQHGITQATTTAISAGTLDRVQHNSVWTVHADRLLGLEAFSPDLLGRKVYIVDFEDRTSLWQAGLDSITVTERVDPYRTAISRALSPAARLEPEALPALIDSANAVSGKWNLDLLNLPINKLRERLGLLAAIATLRDLDGAFQPPSTEGSDLGGVLLPLEEMFRLLPASGLARPKGRSCDDLLYLRIHRDDGAVRIVGRLLEVKFKTAGQPDLAVARRELERTREWLKSIADASAVTRPFRSRDLSEFIRAGAIRNRSFGLGSFSPGSIEEVAAAVSQGDYQLDFTYEAGGQALCGDVISLEIENPVPAVRILLPGEGLPLGYVRLGSPALERLAAGKRLTTPVGWPAVTFPGAAVSRIQRGPKIPEPCMADSSHRGSASLLGGSVLEGENDSPAGAAPSKKGPVPVIPEPDPPSAEGIAAEVASKATELDAAAAKYGLQLAPFDIRIAQVGPSVIRFRTRLLGRESIANVRKRALDLGREVGFAEGVLVDQEPYLLTVDVPRADRVVVNLSDHFNAVATADAPGALPFLLGMAPSGEVRVADLARLPHLLVAGATGSGKSVLLRGLLCCLARVRAPMQLQILIIDPKQVDFLPFRDLIHLAEGGIVTDPVHAVGILSETLEREVRWRQEKLGAAGVTSALEFYEAGGALEELPQMVILVDEFADLAASLDRSSRDAFMQLIQRFGQLTRAFGIYLVLATQRPSVQVITGDIKANLTARVALKVQSATDSMTILGRGGAESLRDRGDLIFDHGGRSERLQGFYTGPADVLAAKSIWTAGQG